MHTATAAGREKKKQQKGAERKSNGGGLQHCNQWQKGKWRGGWSGGSWGSWASHTLWIRKHMQWSREGLGGEWELKKEGECFFLRGVAVEWWMETDGNINPRRVLFLSPCIHPPLCPHFLPPTHLHRWTLSRDRTACASAWSSWTGTGGGRWVTPSFGCYYLEEGQQVKCFNQM